MRKFKAILRLIFSDKYLLVVNNKENGIYIDYTMPTLEVMRNAVFLKNYLETDSAVEEFYKIVNNP